MHACDLFDCGFSRPTLLFLRISSQNVFFCFCFCFCFCSSEDCGHVPHLEQPSVTADMIASFMGSTTLWGEGLRHRSDYFEQYANKSTEWKLERTNPTPMYIGVGFLVLQLELHSPISPFTDFSSAHASIWFAEFFRTVFWSVIESSSFFWIFYVTFFYRVFCLKVNPILEKLVSKGFCTMFQQNTSKMIASFCTVLFMGSKNYQSFC